MNDGLEGLLPSVAVLGTAGAVALYLTLSRVWAAESRKQARVAVRVAMIAVVAQAVHFGEELVSGFHERWPAVLGLGPIPLRLFVVFNLSWLFVWLVCAWFLPSGRLAVLFPLWFLGIAGVLNAFAHPALSVLAGGYFPGVVTSPVMGVVGALLLRQLVLVTRGLAPAPERVSH